MYARITLLTFYEWCGLLFLPKSAMRASRLASSPLAARISDTFVRPDLRPTVPHCSGPRGGAIRRGDCRALRPTQAIPGQQHAEAALQHVLGRARHDVPHLENCKEFTHTPPGPDGILSSLRWDAVSPGDLRPHWHTIRAGDKCRQTPCCPGQAPLSWVPASS